MLAVKVQPGRETLILAGLAVASTLVVVAAGVWLLWPHTPPPYPYDRYERDLGVVQQQNDRANWGSFMGGALVAGQVPPEPLPMWEPPLDR